jgi:glycosyltransferase involved in cell wall biosynthesis
MKKNKDLRLKKIAFIGNHLPRQCGIATFTTDLCHAYALKFKDSDCSVIAMTESNASYAYPSPVRFEIIDNDIKSYQRAADFLNINNFDVVCLQHEFGIFGGPSGSHVLNLLKELRMPIVTTLHTVLKNPNPDNKKVLEEIASQSDRLIVMSNRAIEYLKDTYSMDMDKVDFIPHGIPDVSFIDPNFYKDKFNVAGQFVVLTFGLVSPDKGIENVIKALPRVVNSYKNITYLIVGVTHPHVRAKEGETYRIRLQRIAEDLNVSKNVGFINRFVDLKELIEIIGASDIYITPYTDEEQITSGTLAYTLGAGKPIISTPYWYAQELLAEERGLIVPFNDSDAISKEMIYLLANEVERHSFRKRAYYYGRNMIWDKVVSMYKESFEMACSERSSIPKVSFITHIVKEQPKELPILKLDYLRLLTDSTGLVQHGIFNVPNYNEGYTTDDNARALIVMMKLKELWGKITEEIKDLTARYLGFLWYAFNQENGCFRNILTFDKKWKEKIGSDDSNGRALWALGTVINKSDNSNFANMAVSIFNSTYSLASDLKSPRAWAFSLMGFSEYLKEYSGDRAVIYIRDILIKRLSDLYKKNASDDWPWIEKKLTYCNAKIPHALLLCGKDTLNNELQEIGLKSLRWLLKIQTSEKGHFIPVGSNGFYEKGGRKARFDQQPIEAYSMISACLEAYRITQDGFWKDESWRIFEWFLGRNDLGAFIYDPETGGCKDGLQHDRLNQNQGAESTIAFLLSLIEISISQTIIGDLVRITENEVIDKKANQKTEEVNSSST